MDPQNYDEAFFQILEKDWGYDDAPLANPQCRICGEPVQYVGATLHHVTPAIPRIRAEFGSEAYFEEQTAYGRRFGAWTLKVATHAAQLG